MERLFAYQYNYSEESNHEYHLFHFIAPNVCAYPKSIDVQIMFRKATVYRGPTVYDKTTDLFLNIYRWPNRRTVFCNTYGPSRASLHAE